ncbi:MAG TPA: MFS transporter [Trebonia sp.]|nr:MFS transporter [Trebonia sp.]
MSQTTGPGSAQPSGAGAMISHEDAGRLDAASPARLIAILVSLVLFSEFVPLQYTMVGVIIPKIGAAFPAAGNSTSWALTIAGVVGAAALVLSGKAADLWGKKRTLFVLAAFFMIGTLICALTSSWALFLVGRGLQAFSFSIPAVVFGIIRDLMPRRWVPIAVGFCGAGFGISAVLAPVIGGLLTDHYSYKSIFWFLAIYAVVTVPPLAVIVPESPLRSRQRFDVPGAMLFGAGIGGVLIYVSEGANWGWGTISCLGYLIGGVVLLAGFIAWEMNTSEPMMDLSLLRSPRVSTVMVIALFATAGATLPQFTLPYMFETPKAAALKAQVIAGISAKEHVPASLVGQFVTFRGDISYAAGFSVFQFAWHVVIFMSVASMIFGPVGGLMARRHGGRLPLILSGAAFLASFLLWWQFHEVWEQSAAIGTLLGIAAGFYYGSNQNLLLDAVPAHITGISSAMLAVFGSIGSSLATALATPILTSHPFQLVATPPGGKQIVSNIPQVYTASGYALTYLVIGGIIGLATLAFAVALRSGREPARGGATMVVAQERTQADA